MKLVTGIEAIQSGKPWKHKSYDGWMTDSMYIEGFTSEDLRKKEFIIKEEPREFWIRAGDIDKTCKYCGTPISSTDLNLVAEGNWIRVREVDK